MTGHVFRERPDGGLDFIGDFDGLYRDDHDPWEQAGRSATAMSAYYLASRSHLAAKLSQLCGDMCVGLEVGCGLGHATAFLAAHVGGKWSGADISPVAIEKARALQRRIEFHVADISATAFPLAERYDVVVLSQLLWYVLDRLHQALDNCAALIGPGGILAISQAFLRDQRYGRDIIDGFQGAAAIRHPDFHLIHADLEDSRRHVHDDGLVIFRRV